MDELLNIAKPYYPFQVGQLPWKQFVPDWSDAWIAFNRGPCYRDLIVIYQFRGYWEFLYKYGGGYWITRCYDTTHSLDFSSIESADEYAKLLGYQEFKISSQGNSH